MSENHLDKLPAWSEALARQLAADESRELTEEHLDILHVARSFYSAYGFSPSMRPLLKHIASELDVSKGRSIYLMQLFPPSPAMVTARLAGLPKPKNCM